MSPGEEALAVRNRAGLFRLAERALLAVRGGDRVRWLDGMLSNEVAGLGQERSGCHATLLTRTGRIVADLHVLWRPDELWLELDAAALAPASAHLEKFIIADDVELEDRSAAWQRLGLEGPAAASVLAGAGLPVSGLAGDGCRELDLGDSRLVVAAYGWSGEPAFQLFVPSGAAQALAARLLADGQLLEASAEALEILRIEAGVPRYGSELDETVLPDEARLEAAVSTSKGCYAGQEVIARLRSRGQPSSLLVGLHTDGDSLLPTGAAVTREGRRIGEVTSACRSPRAGSIALAFMKRAHAEPGNRVLVEGREARVARLPFAGPGA